MQQIEKMIGVKSEDFTSFIPTLKQAYSITSAKYDRDTPHKLKMVDSLIVLSGFTFVLQVAYGVLVCRDPFNSFIAGVFCSMGIFAMTMSLRIQLSGQKDFEMHTSKMIFEYIIGCLLMFFAAFLLMG